MVKKTFQEYNRLKSKYFDYYGWRRSDFNGETINIKDGLRRTTQSKNIKDEYILWFFGGSTMWGTGVNDENTLPSLVAKETDIFQLILEKVDIHQDNLWLILTIFIV